MMKKDVFGFIILFGIYMAIDYMLLSTMLSNQDVRMIDFDYRLSQLESASKVTDTDKDKESAK